MSWKKRLRELSERNPDALPDWMKKSGSEKVWDRAVYHKDTVDVSSSASVIVYVLRWLAVKGELNSNGVQAIKLFESNPDEAKLASSQVSVKAFKFLDRYYDEWFSAYAINAVVDRSTKLNSEFIDKLWYDFGRPL